MMRAKGTRIRTLCSAQVAIAQVLYSVNNFAFSLFPNQILAIINKDT